MKIGTQHITITPEESGRKVCYSTDIIPTSAYAVLKMVGLFVLTLALLASSVYWTKSAGNKREVEIVHDTVMVHDTIVIRHETSPVTYVCQGICDGFEGFEKR